MNRQSGPSVRLAFALVLLLCPPALATVQTGKLNGAVYDANGVPLAGVTVNITSPNLMGSRQTRTSDDGSFRFVGLPPGRYTVRIDEAGFVPFSQDDIRVGIAGTATLDIILDLPTARETITVTARRPVVDREKTSLGQNYEDELLEDIPILRRYQSVARLAPGVVDQKWGGWNPNIHGSTVISNHYLIDGVTVTDPVMGTFSANFNFDAIQEVQVLTGGMDAEYGQAQGGIINLVTKGGGNKFHLDTSFYLRPGFLRLEDEFEKEGAPFLDAYEANANIGGPIIEDRLWYFASVQFEYLKGGPGAALDPFNPSSTKKITRDPAVWTSVYYLGKLTFQVTPRHRLIAMVQGDPTAIDNNLQDFESAPEAEQHWEQGGGFYSLTWEALWTDRLFQKTQLAFKNSYLGFSPQSGCTSLTDEACRSHFDFNTKLTTGNFDRIWEGKRYRLQFDSSWTLFVDNFVGDHELKAGWQFAHTWTKDRVGIPGGADHTDKGGASFEITRMVPDENGELSLFETAGSGDQLSVYLQDSWKLTRNLIIRPGVRFDWSSLRDNQGVTRISFLTTSPRINLVWTLTGDGKTVLRAGYNRYVSHGNLLLSGFTGTRLPTESYEYNLDTGRYDIFLKRRGGTLANAYADGLTAPHTDEVSLQIERELFTDFSLGITGIWREAKHLFEDRAPTWIWNADGTEVIGSTNPDSTVVYEADTPREAWQRYWGLEITVRKHLSDDWQLAASYTYSRAEGAPHYYHAEGDYITPWTSYLDSPPRDKFLWSWLPYDRRHAIKIDGAYHLPWGISVGTSISWATGFPYTKTVDGVLDYLAGYDRDHPGNPYWNRLPDRFNVDLKIVWDLTKLTGLHFDIIVAMFNLMHLRDKLDIETDDQQPGSPVQYGEFKRFREGFQAALGVRYRY